MESIPESSNVYIYGDLGFEPTPIKLRESTMIVEKEIFTPIASETFSIKELVVRFILQIRNIHRSFNEYMNI